MAHVIARPNNSMAAGRWSFGNDDGAQDETPTSSDSRHQPLRESGRFGRKLGLCATDPALRWLQQAAA